MIMIIIITIQHKRTTTCTDKRYLVATANDKKVIAALAHQLKARPPIEYIIIINAHRLTWPIYCTIYINSCLMRKDVEKQKKKYIKNIEDQSEDEL